MMKGELSIPNALSSQVASFPQQSEKDDIFDAFKYAWAGTPWEIKDMVDYLCCPYCQGKLDEVYGDRIWPNLEDLARKKFKICWPCSAWVGIKDDGTLQGYPAKEHIRELRQMIINAWSAVCDTGAMTWDKSAEFRSWLREEKGYDIADLGRLEEEQLRELLHILDKMIIPDTPEIDALFT